MWKRAPQTFFINGRLGNPSMKVNGKILPSPKRPSPPSMTRETVLGVRTESQRL